MKQAKNNRTNCLTMWFIIICSTLNNSCHALENFGVITLNDYHDFKSIYLTSGCTLEWMVKINYYKYIQVLEMKMWFLLQYLTD